MWRWREQYGGTIIEQYKRLGASCDYAEERFTLDEAYVRAVLKVFVTLYEKGLIYRDNYMVNWDPGSRSAISDLEVEDVEVTDTLYYVDYPLASGHGSITVATVRPETMLGDTAIAVHPDDDRYTRLIGETAILPIVGRRLRIIADDYVKPEFGTGALKITPGHDPNDFEIGRKHKLDELTVIGEDGRMTVDAGRFAGMTALEAREAVVAALRAERRINRTEPYKHEVPYSQRSGQRIEPLISLQWFMRMEELAAPAHAAVAEGRVRIHPEGQRRRYLQWLENIRPWCISRQLWWGHRLPVWYRGDETYVGMDPPDGPGWERDPDVLDTWFSSALWPFATLGWPDDTAELKAFYPTNVLLTARDILFLWVARMVFMGLEFAGDIPFDDVYVHSIVQAPDGRRMSKSLGTGIDPLTLLDGGPRPPVFSEGGDFPAYGADAVRYGLLAMSLVAGRPLQRGADRAGAPARQQALQRVAAGAAARAGGRLGAGTSRRRRWRSRTPGSCRACRRPRPRSRTRSRRFEFHRAAHSLYDFVYGELCDWYLEMLKPRLYAEDNAETAEFALHILAETLALAHPVIPFVTEEIWSLLPGPHDLLMGHRWPEPDEALRDLDVESRGPAGDRRDPGAAQVARRGGRGAGRAGAGAAGRRPATSASPSMWRGWRASSSPPTATSRSRPSAFPAGPCWCSRPTRSTSRPRSAARPSASTFLRKEIKRAESKLANQGFVAKAPEAVVQAERDKLEKLQAGAGRALVSRGISRRAEEHLLSLELFGMRFGLERMRRLLTALGSPQERFRAVHVVGTNGKSSTVRFTAALLEAHGCGPARTSRRT